MQNFYQDVRDDHHEIARAVATESIVLLKNTNSALPLKSGKGAKKSIMIFGSDAGPNPFGPNGCPDRNCNNGTLGQGWGSGTVEYPYLISPLEAIQARALSDRTMVEYVLDDYAYDRINTTAAKAPNATCLVFVSSDSGEGYTSAEGVLGDRPNLKLWHGGDKMILSVAERCRDTMVIVHSVGPVDMEESVTQASCIIGLLLTSMNRIGLVMRISPQCLWPIFLAKKAVQPSPTFSTAMSIQADASPTPSESRYQITALRPQ